MYMNPQIAEYYFILEKLNKQTQKVGIKIEHIKCLFFALKQNQF